MRLFRTVILLSSLLVLAPSVQADNLATNAAYAVLQNCIALSVDSDDATLFEADCIQGYLASIPQS